MSAEDHELATCALEHANYAGGGHACRDGEAQLPQFISDDPGRPRFAVAQLGF